MNEAVGFAPAPAVSRLAAAVRVAGGGMFCIKMTHNRRCFDDWSVAYEMAASEVRAGAPALKKFRCKQGNFKRPLGAGESCEQHRAESNTCGPNSAQRQTAEFISVTAEFSEENERGFPLFAGLQRISSGISFCEGSTNYFRRTSTRRFCAWLASPSPPAVAFVSACPMA